MPNVPRSAAEIVKNMENETKRRADIDALFARAAGGDQGAYQSLLSLGGVTGTGSTYDAQNYIRLGLNQLGGTGQAPWGASNYAYRKSQGQGGFLGGVGNFLGGVLKVAAPVGAALIPGIGPLAAGGIAAGGSAVGGALRGEDFNLGKTLLAGGAGYAGNRLLGGQGINRVGQWLGIGGGAKMPGAPGAPPGAPVTAGGGGVGVGSLPGPGGGGRSTLDTILGYAPLALGAAGAVGAAQQQSQADQLRRQALQLAQQDYASRAPLRQAATTRMLAPIPARQSLQGIFADPSNPYYRPLSV